MEKTNRAGLGADGQDRRDSGNFKKKNQNILQLFLCLAAGEGHLLKGVGREELNGERMFWSGCLGVRN